MYQEKQWPEVGTLGYSRLDGTWGGQMVLDSDAECTRIEVVLKPTRSRSIADSPELLEKHVMRHFIEGLRKIEKCSIVRDAFIQAILVVSCISWSTVERSRTKPNCSGTMMLLTSR